MNSTEWNSLFNGQLDDVPGSLDPMTGVQQQQQQLLQQQQQQLHSPVQTDVCMVSPSAQTGNCVSSNGQQPPAQIDRYEKKNCVGNLEKEG